MGTGVTASRKTVRVACFMGATALACVFAASAFITARAQTIPLGERQPAPGEQMLLEADTLVYDRDADTVTTTGGVQIQYDGNRLVADKVTYDRSTRRLIATGKVEIVEKSGNKIYADEIDVTDDFADGFVNALRLETTDKTYFASESAERKDGALTTFNNGVYTACAPCEDHPGRPPIWRVRSKKIIWNGETHIIRFDSARFEFFGLPIAFLPYFEIADPTVKRKSGFLFPGFHKDDEKGFGVTIPYYFALSPTYDLTVSVTPYTKQGFLGEAEWRQQFDNGSYNITIAGISQNEPEAWETNEIDSTVKGRAMIGTQGEFDINPRWKFGWDILAETDKNFAYTYNVDGYNDYRHRSEVYLRGLHDRNYFDLRAMHFDYQESTLDRRANGTRVLTARDNVQAWALPSFDYSYLPDEPIAGGQLTLNVNAQNLHRDTVDFFGDGLAPADLPTLTADQRRLAAFNADRLVGAEGDSGRLTAEAEWKRSLTTDSGIVITPLLAARGDAIYTSFSDETVADINNFTVAGGSVANDVRSAYYRYMATAGMEVRWPILFSSASASQIIEPIAQIFVRPDAPYQSTLGIPNEDAQSLVFDATSLFERDKFGGYDRIEGGTRANLGVRYSADFGGGWAVNGIFGQSYNLAGANPYAQPDLVSVGAYSGLETDVSDFVGLLGLQTPVGLSGFAGARFDEKTFEVRRTDFTAFYNKGPLGLGAQYAFIQAQPLYGFADDRREFTGRASIKFFDHWRAFGVGSYDLESNTLTNRTFGISYADECFAYSLTYTKTLTPPNARDLQQSRESFGFHIALRTIGDFGSNTNQFQQQQ